MGWSIKTGFSVVAVSVLASVGVAAAEMGAGDMESVPTASGRPAWLHSGGPQPIARLQAQQEQNFPVFARERRPADEMPPLASNMLGEAELTRKNTALARAFESPTGTGWVIPGDGMICLALPDSVLGYGVSCAPSERAAAHGLVLVMAEGGAPAAQTVAVLLPEGSHASTGRQSVRTRLEANDDGIAITRLGGDNEVRVVTPRGRRTYPMPAAPPSSPSAKDCGDGSVVYTDEQC